MKKILGTLVLVSLIAAACGFGSSNNNETPAPTPTPLMSPTPSASPTPSMQSGSDSSWEATLMASDNLAKGKYKIMVDNHTVYINTSRDYSKLVGKNVDIKYKGTMDSFTLIDIEAK